MNKIKETLIGGIICFGIVFGYLAYEGIKGRERYLRRCPTHKLIKEYKENLTLEQLKEMNFSFKYNKKEIDDLKLNVFYEALKKSVVGGPSHPENFERLYLTESGDGQYFEIEIIFANKSNGSKLVYCSILYYVDGECVDGVPFISKEMTDWGESISMFD